MGFLSLDAQNTAVTPAYSGAPINVGAPVFGFPPTASSGLRDLLPLLLLAGIVIYAMRKKG